MDFVPQTVAGEQRDWAELPWDALSLIFEKVGAIGILHGAQNVCRPWRKLALDPRTWRCVDMRTGLWEAKWEFDLVRMAIEAERRSAGHLVELSLETGYDDILKYTAERSTELRCLRLVSCYISEEVFIEAIKRFTLLEELEVSHCSMNAVAFQSAGRSFPKLKRFQLNCTGCRYPHSECNDEALAIAKNMPELQELQLFGNRLGNKGLQAILDGCPYLESLDIRQCFSINLDEDLSLRQRCMGLKTLKLPKDSTTDYPYDTDYVGSEYATYNEYGTGPEFYEYDDYCDYYYNDFDDYDDFTAVPELAVINLMFSDIFNGNMDDSDAEDDI